MNIFKMTVVKGAIIKENCAEFNGIKLIVQNADTDKFEIIDADKLEDDVLYVVDDNGHGSYTLNELDIVDTRIDFNKSLNYWGRKKYTYYGDTYR